MKKVLTLSVAALAVAGVANAGFEAGVGVSSVNWTAKTSATEWNGAAAKDTKKDIGRSGYAADILVGYMQPVGGRYHVGLSLSAETGGGKAYYDEDSEFEVKIERKFAYSVVGNFGMDVAPSSTVFLHVGAKNGSYKFTNNTGPEVAGVTTPAPATKSKKKFGLLLGASFRVSLSEKVALDMAYNHVNYGTRPFPMGNEKSFNYKSKMKENNARLGVTYKF